MKAGRSFSVAILAAGNSSRMNYPKLFLPFDGEKKFIQKIIDTYIAVGVNAIILIINADIEKKMRLILSKNYQSHKIKLVVNPFPERGRFYSIQQGLRNINSSFCFIQNIDNPFISKSLLNEMIKVVTNANYVVPSCRKKDGHPILISNEIVKHLLLLKGFDHNLRNELNYFSKIKVPWPQEEILANINTPEEYQKCFSLSESVI